MLFEQFLRLIYALAERRNETKADPETAARDTYRNKRNLYIILTVLSLLFSLGIPVFIFVALFFGYKAYKNHKNAYDDEKVKKMAQKLAPSVMKNLDFEFKRNPEKITSFPQRKGAEVKYTTLQEAKELYNGDVYIGNFTLSKEMADYTPEKVKEQVEKTPLFIHATELTKGLVVLGKMGTGKSVLLKNLLAQQFYNRAVINDVKGEYVESFYRDGLDIIYNIFDARSKLWDIFGDIAKNPALAQAVAEAVVETISKQKDFWLTAAATLFREALLHATFTETDNRYQTFLAYIKQDREKAVEREDKTALSVHATLEPVLETFRILAWLESQNVEKFSLYDFVEQKDSKLFLLLDPAHEKAMKPLTNALLTALISILLSRPDTKEDFTLFLLDEFLSIRIPENIQTQLFTLARSKGIQLITASQYLSKENERLVQNVMNSRQYLAVFPIADNYTIDLLERIGEVEARYISRELSQSQSISTVPQQGGLFKLPIPQRQTTWGYSIQQRHEKEQFKIFSAKMLYQLQNHAFILNSVNPFSFLSAKVKEFYFSENRVNQPFIQRDLTDYYKQNFASQTA